MRVPHKGAEYNTNGGGGGGRPRVCGWKSSPSRESGFRVPGVELIKHKNHPVLYEYCQTVAARVTVLVIHVEKETKKVDLM